MRFQRDQMYGLSVLSKNLPINLCVLGVGRNNERSKLETQV